MNIIYLYSTAIAVPTEIKGRYPIALHPRIEPQQSKYYMILIIFIFRGYREESEI